MYLLSVPRGLLVCSLSHWTFGKRNESDLVRFRAIYLDHDMTTRRYERTRVGKFYGTRLGELTVIDVPRLF